MKLFSRLKDYNSLLEEILNTKVFSSISKSLLFSMIYKLEISYRDYSQVKVDSVTKDEFFINILEVIKNYCDNIKTVEPDSIQAELLKKHKVDAVTNEKERSILTYPTEQSMLYAICDIEPKYYFIKNNFIFKESLQKLLVNGYKQNTMEVLKNFSGWSWDINVNKNKDYISNLIYQNFIIIQGEKFLYDWRKNNLATKDYFYIMKKSIKKVTGNDNYYLCLCKILYMISNKKDKKIIQEQLEQMKKKYNQMIKESEEFQKKNIREINKLKNYVAILTNENTVHQEIIELQKYFLKYMEKKINKIEYKEDMIDIFYELRYYQNILISEKTLIKDCRELKQTLENVLKLAITKACKLGTIKIISMDIDTNYEIIKYILDTKIINLEGIKIYLEIDNDEIFIRVHDKEIFEKQGKKEFHGNKKDIVIKKKKMIKLFN